MKTAAIISSAAHFRCSAQALIKQWLGVSSNETHQLLLMPTHGLTMRSKIWGQCPKAAAITKASTCARFRRAWSAPRLSKKALRQPTSFRSLIISIRAQASLVHLVKSTWQALRSGTRRFSRQCLRVPSQIGYKLSNYKRKRRSLIPTSNHRGVLVFRRTTWSASQLRRRMYLLL